MSILLFWPEAGGGGDATATITGVESAIAAGTATAAGEGTTATLTGVSSSPQAGTLTATGAAAATISGVSSTPAVGSVTAIGDAVGAVTGVSSAIAAGTATGIGDGAVTLSGVSSTPAAGTVTADGGGESAEATITGVETTPAAGTLTAFGDAEVTLVGVSVPIETGMPHVGEQEQPQPILVVVGGSSWHPRREDVQPLQIDATATIRGVAVRIEAGRLQASGEAQATALAIPAPIADEPLLPTVTVTADAVATVSGAAIEVVAGAVQAHGIVALPMPVKAQPRRRPRRAYQPPPTATPARDAIDREWTALQHDEDALMLLAMTGDL